MSYDDMPQKQARIEALREEKGRLQKVRQTIAFYEANAASGKVKKAVLPQMAQQIQPAEGIPLILQQTIRPKNEKYLGKMMEIMDQLLREVPVYRMQCDISEEAVKMSYEAMKG